VTSTTSPTPLVAQDGDRAGAPRAALRRRVLFVVPSMRSGGAERVVLNLVNHLDRSRFEPMLAVGRAVGHYLDQLAPDVPLHELGAERSRVALPALVRVVRRTAPGTILSTVGLNWVTAVARPLFPRDTRVVLREGNSPSAYLEDLAVTAPRTAQVYRRLYPWVYRRADLVVCQSEFMKRDLQTALGVRAVDVRVVPNPVDVEHVLDRAAEPCDLDGRPGPHVVAVGRLARQKGADVLLRAFARLRTERPGAQLWILGEGEDRAMLGRLAEELGLAGAAHFQGVVSNPFPFVARSDVFVSAARYEGVSNAVLEALVCGTPVVATACPSGIDEVVEEGRNGWLVPPEDDAALASALLRALGAGPALDRAGIRARAAARWGVDSVARAYEALL
jgi:glycosyltransferase involved in cell wall biosynthesis